LGKVGILNLLYLIIFFLEYQVKQKDLDTYFEQETPPNDEELSDRDQCLWTPCNKISSGDVESYCNYVQEKCGINLERALFTLKSSNYIINVAKEKLQNRLFVAKSFSTQDTYIFKNAISNFGKNFTKIQQMLPNKSVRTLVEHYYLTKKKQNYWGTNNSDLSDNGSDQEVEQDTKDPEDVFVCQNCRNIVRNLFIVNDAHVCLTCKSYYGVMNQHRLRAGTDIDQTQTPAITPSFDFNEFVDMGRFVDADITFENADDDGDLQIEAKKLTKGETLCRQFGNVLQEKKAKVLQTEAFLKKKLSSPYTSNDAAIKMARAFLSSTRVPDLQNQKVHFSHIWTEREELAAVHACIRFKCDYQAVADILGTKSAAMVKSMVSAKYENLIEQKINECSQQTSKIPGLQSESDE